MTYIFCAGFFKICHEFQGATKTDTFSLTIRFTAALTHFVPTQIPSVFWSVRCKFTHLKGESTHRQWRIQVFIFVGTLVQTTGHCCYWQSTILKHSRLINVRTRPIIYVRSCLLACAIINTGTWSKNVAQFKDFL